MSKPAPFKLIGQFSDHNYGVDDVGELFTSLADAKRKLRQRYANGYDEPCPRVLPSGVVIADLMPGVTREAEMLLWYLPEQLTQADIDINERRVDAPALRYQVPTTASTANVRLSIGARHGIQTHQL